MAFDFPPAQDGLRVTNPESGVTYVYRSKYQSWIIEGVDNQQVRIHTVCCTPCSAAQGDIWFDPCNNCLHVFHDGNWEPVIDCSANANSVRYKGEKDWAHQLPDTGNELGDLWVVLSDETGVPTGVPTLYVWSTIGWIPADRYDDAELRQLIKAEEDARIANDVELQRQITYNKYESETEDQKLWDALGEETDDRKTNDQLLHDLIDNCCTNASNELDKLNEGLAQEIQDRTDGDLALQGDIKDLEKGQDFTNARLDQEVLDRIAGDDQLRDDLAEEKVEREASDDALRALINSKESKWMGEVPTFSDLPQTRFDWKPLTDFQCETVYSISWGPDRFIAGTSGGHAWSSEDGVFWERRNVGVAFNGNVLATIYANGVWLIGGENGLVSRSVDGKSWANHYSTVVQSNIQDFAYNGAGRFVFVTDGGVIATSDDGGTSWTKQDRQIRWGVDGPDSILAVTYSDALSRFVATTQRGMILISDTGVSWDLIDPGLRGGGKLLTVVSVEWAGQPMLIAGGDFPERLIYSVDSLNWVTAPRNYFKEAFPTDLKDCGTHLVAALSNGKTAFAFDALVQSWTVEPVGATERLLAIAWAPTNQHVPYPTGIYVTGGNFGQAFARLPGKGLEPGDTWVVLDEMCLYTWSTLGWVTSCGSGGGGGGSAPGIRRLTAGDCIKLNPATGTGDVVEISLDPNCKGGNSSTHVGENPPTAWQAIGSLWIREPENRVYFWDGQYWVQLGQMGGSSTHIGENPPTSASNGDLWVREPLYSIYAYNGSQWIQTFAAGGGNSSFGPDFPVNPSIGDRHVREPGMGDYVYTGTEWIQVTGSGSGAGSGNTIGDDFPDAPTAGDRHMLTPGLTDYVYSGDEWIQCGGTSGGPAGGGGSTIGDTFPLNPNSGDRHIHMPSFNDYVWTGDQWVQLAGGSSSGGGFSSTLPSNPTLGQRHITTPSMLDYVFTGDEWVQVL